MLAGLGTCYLLEGHHDPILAAGSFAQSPESLLASLPSFACIRKRNHPWTDRWEQGALLPVDTDHTIAHSLLAELGEKSEPAPRTAHLHVEPWPCVHQSSRLHVHHQSPCNDVCQSSVPGDQPLSAWTVKMSAPPGMSGEWFSGLYPWPSTDIGPFKRTRDSLP